MSVGGGVEPPSFLGGRVSFAWRPVGVQQWPFPLAMAGTKRKCPPGLTADHQPAKKKRRVVFQAGSCEFRFIPSPIFKRNNSRIYIFFIVLSGGKINILVKI